MCENSRGCSTGVLVGYFDSPPVGDQDAGTVVAAGGSLVVRALFGESAGIAAGGMYAQCRVGGRSGRPDAIPVAPSRLRPVWCGRLV